jgi:aspartyl-tRNA(Asn)/glutamyl-tRNA(Gln) amidotransferase subunit A
VDRKPRQLRIGISEYFLRDADSEVAAAVEAAVKVFQSMGAEMLEVDMPALDQALEASGVIVSAEALAFHDPHLRDRPEAYGPLVRSRLEAGRTLSAVDLVRAEQHRAVLTEAFAELFGSVNLVLGATLPVLPPPIGATTVSLGGAELSISEAFCRYNAPQNVVGLPALAIGAGFSGSGLPIGFQLVARWGEEAALLSAGAAFQRETAWHTQAPN